MTVRGTERVFGEYFEDVDKVDILKIIIIKLFSQITNCDKNHSRPPSCCR